MNLSRRGLSEEDVSLLSKGLKFSPTPTDIDKAKLKEDLEAYKRRMRLRWHFRNNTDSDSQDASDNNSNTFRIKSTWQPPKDDPVLENYLSLLEKEVLSVSPDGKNFSNLSSCEQLCLKQLSFSASARQTQPPTAAVLNSALSFIFLPPPLYYRLL